jgi:hypothetical protein
MKIKITDFGARHFDPKFGGTKILNYTVEEFEKSVQELSVTEWDSAIEGYAPFCKLFPVKNFTDARVGSLPITLENYQYLRSGYSSRTEKESPTLSRWLELPLGKPKADWLMLVLYSKEQIEKEAKGEGDETRIFGFDADWGIVAILGQDVNTEIPPTPITIMRNALGIEHGGSGVPIDKDMYAKSVDYWSHHAIVK